MINGYAWLRSFLAGSLTTRFAVYSFVCIGLMTAVLWLIVSNYLVKQILEREWETTAQLVRADVRKFLEAYDFQAKDRKSVGHKFTALHEHMRLSPAIVRFKVYNPNAIVIWSDDKQLVGKSFGDDVQLQRALRGEVVANLSSLTARKSVSAPGSPDKIVEVYVPVYAEKDRQLLGVFETYRRADSVLRHVDEARLVVLLTTAAGGLLIYISLFAMVRQAARQIDEQQANLLKMQSELIASQRMAAMGETAGAVAHGIGNPLSSIRAAAQVALLQAGHGGDGATTHEIAGNLQNIVREVDRVQKRMQGLLNFAKPLEPRLGSVDVNAVVREAVATMRSRFAETKIQPQLDLAPDLPNVSADLGHLEQALMGLLTNAVEATGHGGAVAVRTRSSPPDAGAKAIHISVEDSGEGIPPENLPRVFEPFFTTKPHGTGIGLPLAKKFIEVNGGSIAIGKGARFGTKVEITLPAAGDI